jgi:hypothetical protein
VVPCIDIMKIVIWDTTNLMQTVFGGNLEPRFSKMQKCYKKGSNIFAMQEY